jgi:hypothetical protein
MIRQHAVSVTVGVGVWQRVPVVSISSAVLRWQCANLADSVHVCAHMYESRTEGGADDTGVGREFPTLIAHVGVPVAAPHR